MSYSNSLTTSRYAEFEAASKCLDAGDACDSFIRAYQPDHRPTMPAQAGVEPPCEITATSGTSFIGLAPRCRAVHVAAPGLSVITITGSDVGTFLVDLPTMLHDHSLVEAYLRLEHGKAAMPLGAVVIDVDGIPKSVEYAREIAGPDPLLAKAVERLESFRQLTPNWNGYDGVVPTHAAIDDCLLFARLLPRLARGPVAMVSGQGEVGLLWERDSDEALVEVGFRGGGSYGYLAVMPDGASTEHEDVPLAGELPPDLVSALSVFLRG